jgi:hypothetical protein
MRLSLFGYLFNDACKLRGLGSVCCKHCRCEWSVWRKKMTIIWVFCAVYSGRSLPTFQRCLLLSSAIAVMMETASISETSVNAYQTTRRINPEEAIFCVVEFVLRIGWIVGNSDAWRTLELKGTWRKGRGSTLRDLEHNKNMFTNSNSCLKPQRGVAKFHRCSVTNDLSRLILPPVRQAIFFMYETM